MQYPLKHYVTLFWCRLTSEESTQFFFIFQYFLFSQITNHNNQQKSHKITIAANMKILQQLSQDIVIKVTLSDLYTINTQSSKSGKHIVLPMQFQ